MLVASEKKNGESWNLARYRFDILLLLTLNVVMIHTTYFSAQKTSKSCSPVWIGLVDISYLYKNAFRMVLYS